MYNNVAIVIAAIKAVGISIIVREAITKTEPTNAPITAAVIPSTNDLTDLFWQFYEKKAPLQR